MGARVKSEADVEEIVDSLQVQALEERKRRSLAVIPPIVLTAKERKLAYFPNDQTLVRDMEAEWKSRQYNNVWMQNEKEVFKDKCLSLGKNFAAIKTYLPRKSVGECVEYYYLSKKQENYKTLWRKARLRVRGKNNPQKANNNHLNVPVIDIMTTRVQTRLQRVQQQSASAQEQQQSAGASTVPTTATTTVPSPTTSTVRNTSPAPSVISTATTTTTTTTSSSTAAAATVTTSSGSSSEQQQQQQESDGGGKGGDTTEEGKSCTVDGDGVENVVGEKGSGDVKMDGVIEGNGGDGETQGVGVGGGAKDAEADCAR